MTICFRLFLEEIENTKNNFEIISPLKYPTFEGFVSIINGQEEYNNRASGHGSVNTKKLIYKSLKTEICFFKCTFGSK